MGCLHDPANVQQTSSKYIQNTRANAGRLLDRVNTLLSSSISYFVVCYFQRQMFNTTKLINPIVFVELIMHK